MDSCFVLSAEQPTITYFSNTQNPLQVAEFSYEYYLATISITTYFFYVKIF